MENNYFEEFEEMEAEKGMTVVACYPGKTAQAIEIDGSLESMQQIVGGYIEAIYPFDDPVAIICNEEGKLNGLPLNRALYNKDNKCNYATQHFLFWHNLIKESLNRCNGQKVNAQQSKNDTCKAKPIH